MIVYKIDKQPHASVNTQIRDMKVVLDEISPTLQTLQSLLSQQSSAISSPSINNFRNSLLEQVGQAITQTRQIAEASQKLVTVSEQAGKHLVAIEEHFGAVLRSPSAATSNNQAINQPQLVQR